MDTQTASNCSHKCTLDLELTKEDLKVNQYHSSIAFKTYICNTEGKSFISAFMEEVKQILYTMMMMTAAAMILNMG